MAEYETSSNIKYKVTNNDMKPTKRVYHINNDERESVALVHSSFIYSGYTQIIIDT